MVFGVFIDVPLLTGTFAIMLVYRRQLTRALLRIHVPPFALYLVLSVPLIIFGEQIDCQPAWCGSVVIPPTLPFLLIEMIVLGAIVSIVHAKDLVRVTLLFSVYGLSFELLVGGLAGAPLLIDVVLAPYVMLGYAYISVLPLRVLIKGRTIPEPRANQQPTNLPPVGAW